MREWRRWCSVAENDRCGQYSLLVLLLLWMVMRMMGGEMMMDCRRRSTSNQL